MPTPRPGCRMLAVTGAARHDRPVHRSHGFARRLRRCLFGVGSVSLVALGPGCAAHPPDRGLEPPRPVSGASGAPASAKGAEPTSVTAATVDPTVLAPTDLAIPAGPLNPKADPDLAGMLAEGAADSGEIALTFDDGPSAETTLEVLRILAAHDVKGAFFVTGRRLEGSGVVAEMNRSVARAIAAAGHTIGNHALDHLPVNRKDVGWNRFQIEQSASAIFAATGRPVHYFRPPFGQVGAVARDLLSARGDELVMWTIDAQDTRETDPEKLTARLVSQLLFAGQGIVLLHDLRGSSVQALSLLLDWLEAHPRDPARGTGFTVVDLPTYLSHAAARPWPYATRLQLFHARERQHAAERAELTPARAAGAGPKAKKKPKTTSGA